MDGVGAAAGAVEGKGLPTGCAPSLPPLTPPPVPHAPHGAPPQDLVSPVVLGAEHLPPEGSVDWARPMLFVGNHGKVSAEAELATS